MSASTHHDLVLLFGDTAEREHELVLVVGREPNNPLPFSPGVGIYDFRAQRRADGKLRTCAFWDQSYGTLAKAAGVGLGTLKSACLARGSSPVAFTDVSPVPVAYSAGSGNMRAAREAIEPGDIDAHVESIFSAELPGSSRKVMDRVGLVVLSGHRHGSFSKVERANLSLASERLTRRCAERDEPIPCIETRFMFGNNQRRNIESLRSSSTASAVLERIMADFLGPVPGALDRTG